MTAGAVDRLEAAQRERIADRTVVRGDADVRRHVPQASEDVGGREPVQQPPQQRRRDRRGVELPRLLRRRGEPLPPPLAVALHDLEEPVADGFQAMVPRGQPRGRDDEQARVGVRPAPVLVHPDVRHEDRLPAAELRSADPRDLSIGAVRAPADSRGQPCGIHHRVPPARLAVGSHHVGRGHILGMVELDRLHDRRDTREVVVEALALRHGQATRIGTDA